MEWDYSGGKERDGQKKTGKANERKEKVKKTKDDKVNGRGEKGEKGKVPRPHTGQVSK